MKTVVDSTTGKVKFCFFGETEISENEIIIDATATGAFYNFETKDFF
jgi:hypothetical protein